MYVTLTTFSYKPGMREAVEKVADNQFTASQDMKGLKSMTYFINPEENGFGSFIIWDSKADAEAAWAIVGPKIQETMSDILTAPPTRSVYEVYKHKT